MDCPNCGETDLWRESADVGIGIIYGPYGCICGWSEDPYYDRSKGLSPAQVEKGPGWYVDSFGGMQRVAAIATHLERFGIPRDHTEKVFDYGNDHRTDTGKEGGAQGMAEGPSQDHC